jgi:hypothetical protein
MPPHLHRRPPLRQRLPAARRVLLLPPHHPKTRRQPKTTKKPPLHLSPAFTRRPLRHSGLHRRGPATHRLKRHRPAPRWPPPLRPPDRQPQPPQTPARSHHRTRDRRRDHHRPRIGHPRPAHRYLRVRKTQKRRRPAHRADVADAGRRRTSPPPQTRHYPHHPGHRRQSTQHPPRKTQTVVTSIRAHRSRTHRHFDRSAAEGRNPLLYLSSRPATSPHTQTANRKIHPPLLSFLHRWPPHSCKSPKPPAPPL